VSVGRGQPGGILPLLTTRVALGEEVALRSTVQDVVIEHRWRYGYRRVIEELRARGMIVNHKRIARIMRETIWLWFDRTGPDLVAYSSCCTGLP